MANTSAVDGANLRRRRGRPPTGGRKQDLVTATVHCIAEYGIGATTTQIAERAGVPKSLIHYHFKSKRQLLEAAFADVIAGFLHVVRERSQRESSPERLLEALAYYSIPFGDEGAERVKFWYQWIAAALSDPELMKLHSENVRAATRAVATFITDLKEAGRLPGYVDAETGALLITASTDGLVLARMSGFSEDRLVYRRAVRRLVKGLLSKEVAEEEGRIAAD